MYLAVLLKKYYKQEINVIFKGTKQEQFHINEWKIEIFIAQYVKELDSVRLFGDRTCFIHCILVDLIANSNLLRNS